MPRKKKERVTPTAVSLLDEITAGERRVEMQEQLLREAQDAAEMQAKARRNSWSREKREREKIREHNRVAASRRTQGSRNEPFMHVRRGVGADRIDEALRKGQFITMTMALPRTIAEQGLVVAPGDRFSFEVDPVKKTILLRQLPDEEENGDGSSGAVEGG